jgi:hypothetical protein
MPDPSWRSRRWPWTPAVAVLAAVLPVLYLLAARGATGSGATEPPAGRIGGAAR